MNSTGSETMADLTIGLLHGDQPLLSDRQIHGAAVAIRREWPALDHLGRMTLDTMLAWAVIRASNLPRIARAAQERTHSAFSRRHQLTVGTDGTVARICGEIHRRLGQYRKARAPHQTVRWTS